MIIERTYHFLKCTSLLLIAIFYSLADKANATELPRELGVQALALAEKIEDQGLYTQDNNVLQALSSESLSSSRRLNLLRTKFTEATWKDTQSQLIKKAKNYASYASSRGTVRDQEISRLFIEFSETYQNSDLDPATELLGTFANSDDWFVRHRALTYQLRMQSGYKNAQIKLQSAQEAFNLIPKEDSIYALEAKILSLEDIAYLHNLLRNPHLGLEAYANVIELSILAESPINGINIINDLIFSFNAWHDHRTTAGLVEVLLRLEEKNKSGKPGLSYLRAAQIYNNLAEFENALKYADASVLSAKSPRIKNAAQLSRIIALLGLKQIAQAQEAFKLYQANQDTNEEVNANSIRKVLYIKSLMAMFEGNYAESITLQNQRLDQTVQYILSTNNTEVASMLASLQNSKERQDERENALKRESDLKQIALDRQKRVNNLLIIIAVIFAIAALIAIAFARYRSRTAAQMSIAADKARAGEKAKSEFLAVMSHELRTPLNGILGLADFLSRTAPTEDLREKNKIILDSGQDLLGLVENILDMTLIEGNDIHPQAEDINIRSLLHKQEDKWRETITEKDIIFTSFIDPYVPERMMLDPRRTKQCIDNLLSNAAKFTMAGRIHMHITAKDIQSTNETELTIIIADTGTGISSDAQTRLFQPFVQADSSMTRHFGGAGLGLAIARSLARLMGGDISVVSREKRGSEFTLTLRSEACAPAIQQAPIRQPVMSQTEKPVKETTVTKTIPVAATALSTVTQPEAPRLTVPSLDHLNILIVDDDIPCQDVLKTILAPTNCRMDCAEDGNMALTQLSQNTYDLVLMDIRMPGMDGVTAVRHIRQSRDAHSHVPVIAVTADVSAETNIKCMAAGVDIFLTKPVRAQELLDAISYVTQEDRTIQTA